MQRHTTACQPERSPPVYLVRGLSHGEDRIRDRLAKAWRQMYSHLRHVHSKCLIQLRREVQRDPCELRMLVQSADPTPAPALNESVRPVDIEALLLVPV